MKQSSIKSLANKNNLKNGLAFAYRAGNFFENSIGKTISDSNLAAPVLEGEPEPIHRIFDLPGDFLAITKTFFEKEEVIFESNFKKFCSIDKLRNN